MQLHLRSRRGRDLGYLQPTQIVARLAAGKLTSHDWLQRPDGAWQRLGESALGRCLPPRGTPTSRSADSGASHPMARIALALASVALLAGASGLLGLRSAAAGADRSGLQLWSGNAGWTLWPLGGGLGLAGLMGLAALLSAWDGRRPGRTGRRLAAQVCSAPAGGLVGAQLCGGDLRYVDLRPGPDGVGADLRRANLSGANLTLARLPGAQLEGATLVGADLSRADLSGVRGRGADLSYADLSHADLRGVRYDAETCWPGGAAPSSESAQRTPMVEP